MGGISVWRRKMAFVEPSLGKNEIRAVNMILAAGDFSDRSLLLFSVLEFEFVRLSEAAEL